METLNLSMVVLSMLLYSLLSYSSEKTPQISCYQVAAVSKLTTENVMYLKKLVDYIASDQANSLLKLNLNRKAKDYIRSQVDPTAQDVAFNFYLSLFALKENTIKLKEVDLVKKVAPKKKSVWTVNNNFVIGRSFERDKVPKHFKEKLVTISMFFKTKRMGFVEFGSREFELGPKAQERFNHSLEFFGVYHFETKAYYVVDKRNQAIYKFKINDDKKRIELVKEVRLDFKPSSNYSKQEEHSFILMSSDKFLIESDVGGFRYVDFSSVKSYSTGTKTKSVEYFGLQYTAGKMFDKDTGFVLHDKEVAIFKVDSSGAISIKESIKIESSSHSEQFENLVRISEDKYIVFGKYKGKSHVWEYENGKLSKEFPLGENRSSVPHSVLDIVTALSGRLVVLTNGPIVHVLNKYKGEYIGSVNRALSVGMKESEFKASNSFIGMGVKKIVEGEDGKVYLVNYLGQILELSFEKVNLMELE